MNQLSNGISSAHKLFGTTLQAGFEVRSFVEIHINQLSIPLNVKKTVSGFETVFFTALYENPHHYFTNN
jgi:hypothetical protein